MNLRNYLKHLYSRLPIIRELRALHDLHRQQMLMLSGMADRALRDIHLLCSERLQDPRQLIRYESQVNSQNGEDGVIAEIFSRIGTTNRVSIEVGAGDGVENNSALLASLGWRAFMVDGAFPAGVHIHRAHAHAPEVTRVGCLVTKESINDLMKSLSVPKEPDLLSLDIDQNTYHVWKDLDCIRPRVVVIEYNSVIPPTIAWVPQYEPKRIWDGSTNYSASLLALCELASHKGYCIVGCDFLGINAFFVRDDLISSHFHPPFTAEHHYQPPRYWFASRWTHKRAMLDAVSPKTGQ